VYTGVISGVTFFVQNGVRSHFFCSIRSQESLFLFKTESGLRDSGVAMSIMPTLAIFTPLFLGCFSVRQYDLLNQAELEGCLGV